MKFLYKFYVRNEQEIRQDLPARHIFVAADSISDAVLGFTESNCLVQTIDFVSPITVVPSKSDISSNDNDNNLLYHIIYRNNDDQILSCFVHACDSFSALSRLKTFLGYTPYIELSELVDDLVI